MKRIIHNIKYILAQVQVSNKPEVEKLEYLLTELKHILVLINNKLRGLI